MNTAISVAITATNRYVPRGRNELHCPVLVVYPAIDPWTPSELSRRFFERIAGEKEWVDLAGCGHLPYEEPGRVQMKESIARFLNKVARAGPSGRRRSV